MENGDAARIHIKSEGPDVVITLHGAMTLPHVTDIQTRLADLPLDKNVMVDLSDVAQFDTGGAWVLASLRRRLVAAGQDCKFRDTTTAQDSLLRTVIDAFPDTTDTPPLHASFTDRVADVGERVSGAFGFMAELVGFFGLFLSRMARSLRHPKEFRGTALIHHCEEVGLKAVPIVALMAFLIGVVLAFQGSTQLKQFGAEVFVVDLIAISILRELGILLTSIIVAGRTASAFTAAIGSMKMREEIDAMRSLGLDPAMMLFVPRILALVLMLPILGLIANVMGLFGGGIMAWVDLGISPAMFTTRLVNGTDISHVIVGMVKAPVFALIIGVVGCHAGMQVQSNAESLGRMTSASVVTAIFAVIVADAAFSIFFAQIGM